MNSRLRKIKDAVDRLAAVVGADPYLLPTYGSSADFGRPHIEVQGTEYHWVVVERGRQLERQVFATLDDLLYRVFRSVTHSLAADWELAHRTPNRDSRRELFRRQLELLERLDPSWEARERARHEAILREHPFSDSRARSP